MKKKKLLIRRPLITQQIYQHFTNLHPVLVLALTAAVGNI